jgi:hypothetical protein
MKKLFLLTIATAIGTFGYAQKVYTSPDFKQLSNQHKTLAILPAEVKLSYKVPPRYTDYEANKDKEIELSFKVQSALYTALLSRKTKNKISYQDIDKTNLLLKKAGMLDSLSNFTKEEIAKVLGVDAIVSEKYEVEHFNTRSEPTPAAASITGSAALTMFVNDSRSGDLLWRFSTNDLSYYSVYSSMNMIDEVTKKPIRSFPYSKSY